jgi:hypothetical protein
VTDVLSHGPEKPPSRARLWFFLVAGVVLLAAVRIPGVAGEGDAPAAPPSPAATPTSRTPTPVLAGVPAAGPLGFRLLMADGPRLLAVTAGGPVDAVTLPELDSSHVVRDLLRVAEGTVIVAGPADGGPGRLYFLRDGAAQPSLLTPADSVFATSQPGRVYALAWKGRTATLAEVDLDGGEQWSRLLPREVRVVRGVAGGLLVRYDEDPDSHLVGDEIQVVDPRSGRVLRRLGSIGQVVAASAEHLVATCAPQELVVSPDGSCKLIHFDLRSGARRDYAAPADAGGPETGLLSPGDRLLAMFSPGYPTSENGIEGFRPGLVHVLDLRTGAWTQVPGVATPFLTEPLMAWSPSGDWLTLGVSEQDHKNLAYWQFGGARLHLQRERLPGGWDQALPSALVVLPD